MTPVRNWGEALVSSFSAALALFFGAIPKIIGFLVIVVIGWIISGLLATAVASLLRALRFDDLAERSGFGGFVRQTGVRADPSGLVADLAKWFVRLIVLVVAFDALGLPAVSQVLQQLLLWLPNLVVALVILVVAGLAANALHGLVRGATAQAGFGSPDLLANIARVAVWGFAIVVAVNQVGVAQTLVNTLFTAIVGALALALGLAFGLGGRETAQQIVSSWYRRGQQAAPRMARAADAAGQQAQAMSSGATAARPAGTATDRERGPVPPPDSGRAPTPRTTT
jgi:Conserved TM helix